MGILVNSYPKDSEAIVGHVKTAGFFDVDYKHIASKKFQKSDIYFPGNDLYLVTELRKVNHLSDYEIYLSDYLWYFFAPNYFSGQGIFNLDNKEIITMFDPKLLIRFVERINKVGRDLTLGMDNFVRESIEKNQELEFFQSLHKLLIHAQEKNAIISFIIGWDALQHCI